VKAGRYSPFLRAKNLGVHSFPLSSLSLVASRWASSMIVLASVAASRSLALIAAVTPLQSLGTQGQRCSLRVGGRHSPTRLVGRLVLLC
jgi:hypothetical protein